jgi:hypothetical protein
VRAVVEAGIEPVRFEVNLQHKLSSARIVLDLGKFSFHGSAWDIGDKQRVALKARDTDRSHGHHAADIWLQPLLDTWPIRLDDNVTDIGFVYDDADAAGAEILLRDQSGPEVIVLAIDALDSVYHRFQIEERNVPPDQVAPKRGEDCRIERHCPFEIDAAELEADGFELLKR